MNVSTIVQNLIFEEVVFTWLQNNNQLALRVEFLNVLPFKVVAIADQLKNERTDCDYAHNKQCCAHQITSSFGFILYLITIIS